MKIIYTKTNKFHIGKVKLVNGENEISKEEWNVIKVHPQVKHFIKKGIISIKLIGKPAEETPVVDKENEAPGNDEGSKSEEKPMNVKEMDAHIATVVDISVLEKMLEKEDRKMVIKAIKKQMKALEEIDNV